MNIRNFIKLAVGVTFLHVLLIRVPYIFENWFGDNFKPDQNIKEDEINDEVQNVVEKSSSAK
jgi:regulator of sirC expression with transglutaminase-like and TPR domain